jgi:hypothetical protein
LILIYKDVQGDQVIKKAHFLAGRPLHLMVSGRFMGFALRCSRVSCRIKTKGRTGLKGIEKR